MWRKYVLKARSLNVMGSAQVVAEQVFEPELLSLGRGLLGSGGLPFRHRQRLRGYARIPFVLRVDSDGSSVATPARLRDHAGGGAESGLKRCHRENGPSLHS